MSNLPPAILNFVDEKVGDFFALSKKEQAAYPVELFKSIFNRASGQRPTGLVNAVTSMLAEKNPDLRSDERSMLVPLAGLLSQRGLNASVQNQGGYLVGDVEVRDLTYLMRKQSVLPRFGIEILTGLTANVPFPREVGEQSFSWYAEGATASYGTGAQYGQLTLSPHRLVGGTSFSRQLRIQAPSAGEYIATGLSRGALVAFEQATFNGSGVAGFPTGVLATAGAGTVTFAGAASWAKLVDFERQISNANATPTGWVSDPATRNKFRTVFRTGSTSRYLWEDEGGFIDRVVGYPAYATNMCPANTIIMADWTKVVWGFWGQGVPMEILVDEFSQKRAEQIEVQCTLYGDCGLLQPAAACYSTDSTLQ
jgi:HK97 family phage major capsid protein